MLKIFPIVRRAFNRLFHQDDIIRMNPLEDKVDGRFRRSAVLEDAKGFL
jgi:hypothetical protein